MRQKNRRLLRVTGGGLSPVTRRVTVERDEKHEIRVEAHGEEALPEGTVQVADPASGRSVAVSRTELTRRDYWRFLDQLEDAVLLDEMLPDGWLGGRASGADDPAIGLTDEAEATLGAESCVTLFR